MYPLSSSWLKASTFTCFYCEENFQGKQSLRSIPSFTRKSSPFLIFYFNCILTSDLLFLCIWDCRSIPSNQTCQPIWNLQRLLPDPSEKTLHLKPWSLENWVVRRCLYLRHHNLRSTMISSSRRVTLSLCLIFVSSQLSLLICVLQTYQKLTQVTFISVCWEASWSYPEPLAFFSRCSESHSRVET